MNITQHECICSLRYPACNAHAPYCHLLPVRLYKILPHYLTNGWFSQGGGAREVTEHKMYVDCLHNTEELSDIWSKLYTGLYPQHPLFLSILMKPEFSRQILRKILKYKISWKFVQWQPSCPMWIDGRTDIRDEAKTLFSHFCERASKYCYVEARSIASRRLSLPATQHALYNHWGPEHSREGLARGVQMTRRVEWKGSTRVQCAEIRNK